MTSGPTRAGGPRSTTASGCSRRRHRCSPGAPSTPTATSLASCWKAAASAAGRSDHRWPDREVELGLLTAVSGQVRPVAVDNSLDEQPLDGGRGGCEGRGERGRERRAVPITRPQHPRCRLPPSVRRTSDHALYQRPHRNSHGLSRAQFTEPNRRSFESVICVEDRSRVNELVKEELRREGSFSVEYRLADADRLLPLGRRTRPHRRRPRQPTALCRRGYLRPVDPQGGRAGSGPGPSPPRARCPYLPARPDLDPRPARADPAALPSATISSSPPCSSIWTTLPPSTRSSASKPETSS